VVKLEGGRPWGFKIAGGAEVNKPILITKVEPEGQAAKFGIKEGDMIARYVTSPRYCILDTVVTSSNSTSIGNFTI